MRRDGSSRFGPANNFHDFGSVGVGWLISQEKFFRKKLSFISFAKLRSSYGTTGNDQIGDYRFYDLFSSQQYAYQGIVGLTALNLFNPKLAWEETKKLEFGFELGLFKDKFLLNMSYYNNRSSNQLLYSNLPTQTGFSFLPINFPQLLKTVDGIFYQFYQHFFEQILFGRAP